MKLAREERESVALHRWLSDRVDSPLATSVLADVEVPRALIRTEPAALDAGDDALDSLERVELSADVRQATANIEPWEVRSLDAVHLATALWIRSQQPPDGIEAFVTYDRRQAAAARAAGLTVVAPGASPPV